MKKIVAGHEIGQALCDALGLPKHTKSFELRCAVGEAVTVKCEYFPSIDVYPLKTALAMYELGRRTESPAERGINFDAWLRAKKDAAHEEMMVRHAALSRMDRARPVNVMVTAAFDARPSAEAIRKMIAEDRRRSSSPFRRL